MKLESNGSSEATAYLTPSEAQFIEIYGRRQFPDLAAKAAILRTSFALAHPTDPLTQLEAIANGTHAANIVTRLTGSVTMGNSETPLTDELITSLELQEAERAAVDANGIEQHVMGPVKLNSLDLFDILTLALEQADDAEAHLGDTETLAEVHDVVRKGLADESNLSAAEIEDDIAMATKLDRQYHLDQIAVTTGLIAVIGPRLKL